MFHIADGVMARTVGMVLTHVGDTQLGLTPVPRMAVSVLITLAGVVTGVTHGGGVLAVQISVGAS